MEFSKCGDGGYIWAYDIFTTGADVDRVMCVDLNNEGFDEVLITRSRTWELIVLENTTGN